MKRKDRERLVQILAEMKGLEHTLNASDPEAGHSHGDSLLCEALKILGQEELVEAYDKLTRWCG